MTATFKRIQISLLLICLSALTYSQSLSMDVMASSGSEFTGDEFSVSWTIGENFIEIFEVEEGIQTLGFHQTDVNNMLLIPQADNMMWIYPNPVSSTVTLQSEEYIGEAVLKVVSITGKIVLVRNIQMETSHILNLSVLTGGTYHLQIITDKVQEFTFIKL